MYETCSKNKGRRRSDVSIVNFEQISHTGLMFLLLALNKLIPVGNQSVRAF